MANLISDKIAGVDLVTLGLGGFSKYAGERLLSPMIGNGTFKSGAIKLIGAMAMQKFLGQNKYAKAVSLGLGFDGVEDIITQVVGASGFSIGNQQDRGVI